MKKKIQLFLYNLKNSWMFLTVIFVELIICMSLLAVALTNYLGVNNKFSYYNAKVSNKSFVMFKNFSSEMYSTAENVSKWLNDDLKSLATTVILVKYRSMMIGEKVYLDLLLRLLHCVRILIAKA